MVPSHYRIRLEPDLERHTFEGSVTIDLDVVEATETITLHAVDLDISDVALERSGERMAMTSMTTDEDYQRVMFGFESLVRPGPAQLHIRFSGELNDRLHGFYRSTFEDVDGVTQTIATTQFQATDARRAFPCFDEPAMKATFGITLVVPTDVLTVSNTPETSRTITEDGRIEISFADTMKMSSYLVAFVVGPFEVTDPVDVDGVPLRVVTRRGTTHLADFALEAAAFCLRYLSDYYGIPYPSDKIDLVAIPDFAAGAMENLGCVTFRETALLVDLDTASQGELIRVLDVIGHELAHMWFGDLVTMEWWNGIWLNEAFATFMEMKATDAMKPEWKRWSTFGSTERPWAFDVDALATSRPVEFAVGSPEEANEMFDALTYGKGSAVLRMMEQFLGEAQFRSGVSAYLRRHAHGNTVTADLWSALDDASHTDVGSIMDSWILQAGHPLLDVVVDGPAIRLDQHRYLALPDESDQTAWKIPVQIRGAIDGRPFVVKRLVTGASETINLDGEPDWLIANAGGHGFYRTAYDQATFDGLLDHLDELEDLERFVTVDDAWAFVQNGHRSVHEYVDLAMAFRHESEFAIWQTITSSIADIRHHVVPDDKLEAFADVVRALYGPLFDHLGWEPRPEDSSLDRRLRGLALSALGLQAADPAVIERAGITSAEWLAGPASIDPDVAQAALFITSAQGDAATVEHLLAAKREAPTPQIEMRILQAIGLVDDEEAVDAVIEAMRDGRIRTQDVSWVYGSLLARRDSGPHAWRHLRRGWDELTAMMPPMTIRRAVEGLPKLSRPELVADIEAFFAETENPHITTAVAQNLERLRANRDLRLREQGRYTAEL